MKITQVETWTEHLPLKRPYTIAFKRVARIDLHFVRLETNCGHVGWGSAAPTDVTQESPEACYSVLDSAAHGLLMGKDPRCLRPLTCRLEVEAGHSPAARAALDMALYDLAARAAGVSVVDFLGRCHKVLPTSITIGIMPVEQTLREAKEYLARQFHCLKVKLGLDYAEDVERLRALRKLAGPGIHIRVDANQGYSAVEVVGLAREAGALGIAFIEQPLPANAVDAMRAMPRKMRPIMAADESLHTPKDALTLAHDPPFGIFNIKLMKCGGITSGLAIADLAALAGIDVMWGCMDESRISIAAALHTAYASQATRYLDLDGSFDLSRDVVAGGFKFVKGGLMHTLDKPGLGVHFM